ncbi:B12-binding domain-containing protein [Aquisphaera insulae]|uniref:B12-binding domain-containing protein n=1 Tax=Aquisphaera insulae TaxID=2712864 RepID=UPI0013ED5C2D|nr:B12-binding domain-containing protein [Aquisphaera insulae]
MPNLQYVSTAEVARALGIGVSTVKRWVDEGILPAHKTAGGHRKLLLADVLRLVREGDFPQLDLSPLRLVAETQGSLDPKVLSQQLLTALKRGEGDAVRSLIHGAHQSGVPMETLADFVIAPAMNQLGQEWEAGRIEVFHEHRSTQLCMSVLYELKAVLLARADRDRPLAVGGSPELDYYMLANLLAEMVLLDAGWRAIDLGPHTPIRSFRQAISELHPRLVWISVSHLADRERFLAEYLELYQEAERAGVAVAIGGRALSDSLRSAMPYTCYGDGLRHLAAFARSHHGPARPPRRGRPSRTP